MNDTKLNGECQRLAAKECANNFGGFCVWKDKECSAAPGTGLCSYFRESVLELDSELTTKVKAYMGEEQAKSVKTCVACNSLFVPEKVRQIFCPECRRNRRREQTRRSMTNLRRKQKGRM